MSGFMICSCEKHIVTSSSVTTEKHSTESRTGSSGNTSLVPRMMTNQVERPAIAGGVSLEDSLDAPGDYSEVIEQRRQKRQARRRKRRKWPKVRGFSLICEIEC